MKTHSGPRTGFFRRHGVLLTAAGSLFGAGSATFIYTVEKPVYESSTRFRPLRPATDVSGISHSEWLLTELVAIGSEQNLLRVVKNLNLENEWGMTAGEAAFEVQNQIDIELVPGTAIIEINNRGEKAVDCAALVNALVVARTEMTASAIQAEHRREAQMYEARVYTLKESVATKYAAVISAARRMGVIIGLSSDSAVVAASLTGEAEAAREAWVAEKARLADMQSRLTTASLTPSIPTYAETLQEGKPSLHPVGPVWFPRTARWTVTGTIIGLTMALCLAAFRRRMSKNIPGVFPPRPVAAGEY